MATVRTTICLELVLSKLASAASLKSLLGSRFKVLAAVMLCFPTILAGVAIDRTFGADDQPDSNGRAQSTLVIRAAAKDSNAGPIAFCDRPQRLQTRVPAPANEIGLVGSSGLLSRELVRQSILIAARDGCGARTRDAVLGESGGEGKPLATLVIEWNLGRAGARTATIRKEDGEILWSTAAIPPGWPPDPSKMTAFWHEQAKGPLVDALVKAGLKRVDRKPEAVNLLPQEIDSSLDRITAISQFAAVRRLHEQLRLHGPSPILFGPLARAYACLGVLTEHHWHSAHKVFKARAMLYGLQAAESDAKSPSGLWSLAFAEAIVGRQQDALKHLAEADQRKAEAPKPPWVERIRLYCLDEYDKLIEGEGANDPLARLLAFLVAEGGSGIFNNYSDVARSRILMAASELLLLETDCFRVHDAACRFSGVSLQHQATTVAPMLFEKSIRQSLEIVPGVPADLGADIPKSLEQLASSRDKGEPSLATLGMLIRETRFVQTWRRMNFVRFLLAAQGVDDPPYDPALIRDHPLKPFLDGHISGFDRPEFRALAQRLMTSDLELTYLPIIRRIGSVDRNLSDQLGVRAMSHGDEIARDLAEEIRDGQDSVGIELAQRLLKVRPNSPVARSALVQAEPNLDPKLLAEWEKDPTAGPGLLGALGRRYSAAKKWEDAERCFTRTIAASPDRSVYRELAAVYKAQDRFDKWKETLEAFLQKEDYGLDHAQVRNEIAQEYMSKKQFREALPYAEAAAQSGAGWAMTTVALCREGLGEWKESEEWMRAVSERYSDNADSWYWWCRRTGHGDVKQALALAKPRFATYARNISEPRVFNFGNVLIAAGERRLALEMTKRWNDRAFELNLAIRVAILADAIEDFALRDKTLAQIAADKKPGGVSTKKALIVVSEWLAKPDADKVGPDMAKLDAILAAMPKGKGNLAYILAQFLDQHGRKEDAVAFLSLTINTKPEDETDPRPQTLARIALRDAGLDPDKVKPHPLPAPEQRR